MGACAVVVDTVTCMGTKSSPMKERENDRRTRWRCMAAAAVGGGVKKEI